ncbi:MAG TPA: class I SAM-dependent methyltransferase [Nitrososphaeraceae archaeon]|nr:class I SAM-dependent methyltransferase [Nitrososphaeraceae archaeon]
MNSVESLPFFYNYFDAIYSHMFHNMGFTDDELESLFKETNRVLKNNGLPSFSVRNEQEQNNRISLRMTPYKR